MASFPCISSAVVLSGTLLAISAPVNAALVERTVFSHAAANCQAALPVFDGNIRKRPKAVANEGTSTAFITCAFEQLPEAGNRVQRAVVVFVNRNAGPVSVSCTFVNGFLDNALSPSLTKTTTLQGNQVGSLFASALADNGNQNFSYVASSCALPPGVEIAYTTLTFFESNGI